MIRSRRVIVTGAAGFIGSRLVSQLASGEFPCLGIDNLATGCSPLALREDVQFHVQDICEVAELERIFKEFLPQIVVHLAAIHHIPTCESNPSKALYVNIVGTQNVLKAAAVAGCEKFVLASTGGVYDWVEGALTEDTPIRPTDIYTLSKVTNERQLGLWIEGTARTGIIARIFNTIGRNDLNGHLIPDILRQLESSANGKLIKLGNLHTRRDYIHVEDTAACLARIVRAEQSSGLHKFNVGTGEEHNVQFIVECIARIRNSHVECRSDPSKVRKVDRRSQVADMSKTCRELNWAARFSLEEALKLTVGEEG